MYNLHMEHLGICLQQLWGTTCFQNVFHMSLNHLNHWKLCRFSLATALWLWMRSSRRVGWVALEVDIFGWFSHVSFCLGCPPSQDAIVSTRMTIYMLLILGNPKLNLHLPQLLGRGWIQIIHDNQATRIKHLRIMQLHCHVFFVIFVGSPCGASWSWFQGYDSPMISLYFPYTDHSREKNISAFVRWEFTLSVGWCMCGICINMNGLSPWWM